MKENDELKKLLNTLYGVNMELELKLTRMESMENCNKYIRDMCPKCKKTIIANHYLQKEAANNDYKQNNKLPPIPFKWW